jgi:hypothetical protein
MPARGEPPNLTFGHRATSRRTERTARRHRNSPCVTTSQPGKRNSTNQKTKLSRKSRPRLTPSDAYPNYKRYRL